MSLSLSLCLASEMQSLQFPVWISAWKYQEKEKKEAFFCFILWSKTGWPTCIFSSFQYFRGTSTVFIYLLAIFRRILPSSKTRPSLYESCNTSLVSTYLFFPIVNQEQYKAEEEENKLLLLIAKVMPANNSLACKSTPCTQHPSAEITLNKRSHYMHPSQTYSGHPSSTKAAEKTYLS